MRLAKNPTQTAIPPCKYPLQKTSFRPVELERDGPPADAPAQERTNLLHPLERNHRRPLKRRMRLRHEGGYREIHPCRTLSRLPSHPADLLRHAGNRRDILIRLAGQPDHEVKFDVIPPLLEGGLHAPEQVLVADLLVDDAPQPLRGRLGRQRERRLANRTDQAGQFAEPVIHAQRGQVDADLPFEEAHGYLADQSAQIRVVAAA